MSFRGPFLRLKKRLGLKQDLSPIVITRNQGQRKKLEKAMRKMDRALWPDDNLDVSLDKIRGRPKVTISFSESVDSYCRWEFDG